MEYIFKNGTLIAKIDLPKIWVSEYSLETKNDVSWHVEKYIKFEYTMKQDENHFIILGEIFRV